MGVTAENVAKKFEISRREQDEFAAASQQKAEAAQKAGRFKDEIAPIDIVSRARARPSSTPTSTSAPGTTLALLGELKPAFSKDGTVTAGNASGINDGAAAVMMMSARKADELGLAPAGDGARLFVRGCRSEDHGHGTGAGEPPVFAEGGLDTQDLDLMEINEAFAAQAIAVNRQMGWDTSQDQREWRRHRHRPSDRRVRLPDPGDAAARDGRGATPRRVSRVCASAAAWASRSRSSADPLLRSWLRRTERACSSTSCLTTPGSASVEMSPS